MEQWKKFKEGNWQKSINVSDFINFSSNACKHGTIIKILIPIIKYPEEISLQDFFLKV